MSIGDRVSTGVGGAGNIGSPSQRPTDPTAQNYTTPSIKTNYYPTGRGGAGNMAHNDDPSEARKAQDVAPQVISTPSAPPQKLSSGRGGAGNMVGRDNSASRGRTQKTERSGSGNGVIGKAQEVLEKIRSSSGASSSRAGRRRGSEAGSVRSNGSRGSNSAVS